LNAATFLTMSTAIDLPEMPKRKLADRILDEIVGLRRPQSLLVELSASIAGAANASVSRAEAQQAVRRQIIIE